jgi:hypothetical protein
MDDNAIILLLVSFILGPMLGILVTPVFCFIRKLMIVPLLRKGLVEKAKAKGHVITAHLTKSDNVWTGSNDGTMCMTPYTHGYYRYEYRGKSYTYWAKTANTLPEQITLYFQRNPRKACLATELGLNENPRWFLHYLMCSAIMVMVSYIWIVPMFI